MLNNTKSFGWMLLAAAAVAIPVISGCNHNNPDSTSNPPAKASTADQGTATPTPAPAPAVTPVAAPNAVTITNYSFDPPQRTVTAGTTVIWTNKDEAGHTVTSGTPAKPGGPLSGKLEQGKTYSYTFTTPGEYPYFCEVHPSMIGTITVVKAP